MAKLNHNIIQALQIWGRKQVELALGEPAPLRLELYPHPTRPGVFIVDYYAMTGQSLMIAQHPVHTDPRKHCISIMWRSPDGDKSELLIEQLRHAGILSIVSTTLDESGVNFVLRIHCPNGVNSAVWAAQNSARMQSFGINAVDAQEI